MPIEYDIRLTITYSYEAPAASNRTLLRILPLNSRDQQLVSGFVSADPPPDFLREGVDFFGNPTTEMTHIAPVSDIVFHFSGRVRRSGPARLLDLSCGLGQLAAEIAAVNSISPSAPHHFLGESERIRYEPKIADFAQDLMQPGMPAFQAIQTVSRALNRHFEFDPEATEVTTRPIDAFESRRGVCQDISHVMISALRGIGIPAGYVSGFLRTTPPPGQPRLEGADAMHAWVRAWAGMEMGWIEIDPTNDLIVGSDHIAVAVGRDYADVAPVKGSSRTAGSHTTEHQVDVLPL